MICASCNKNGTCLIGTFRSITSLWSYALFTIFHPDSDNHMFWRISGFLKILLSIQLRVVSQDLFWLHVSQKSKYWMAVRYCLNFSCSQKSVFLLFRSVQFMHYVFSIFRLAHVNEGNQKFGELILFNLCYFY